MRDFETEEGSVFSRVENGFEDEACKIDKVSITFSIFDWIDRLQSVK